MPPKGLGPTRRARYERSRSYLLEHTSEVQCVEYSWVYQGKSAIRIHRELLGSKKMIGLSFWAKGYCASTVGLDEEIIKKYIREQNNKH